MTIRRMKTYTGEQGYVYQYYFVGQRATSEEGAGGVEYIFDVTADRKTMYSVSVVLPEKLLTDWAAAHGRQLTDAEQYGAVKMRLFQGFDEIEDMMANGRRLVIDSVILEAALEKLGVA